MDLGPIAGIRSIALLNAQKAKAEQEPHFEIDASARSGDDSSHQDTPPRQKFAQKQAQDQAHAQAQDQAEEEFRPTPAPDQQAAADAPSAEPVVDSEGQLNWFV